MNKTTPMAMAITAKADPAPSLRCLVLNLPRDGLIAPGKQLCHVESGRL
jgi:hypothetical protein